MATELAAARMLVYQAAFCVDQGSLIPKKRRWLNYLPGAVANKLASQAVQIHGGYGFIKGHKVERLMRDAKITKSMKEHQRPKEWLLAGSILR